jgi:hypothetical protein
MSAGGEVGDAAQHLSEITTERSIGGAAEPRAGRDLRLRQLRET